MYKNLLSFEMVRTPVQALGFYIAFVFIGILIGALAGGVGAVVLGATGTSAYEIGAKLGAGSGVAYSLLIGVAVVFKKKLGFGYLVLSLLGAFLAVLMGGLLGLIPAAFMTTRQANLPE